MVVRQKISSLKEVFAMTWGQKAGWALKASRQHSLLGDHVSNICLQPEDGLQVKFHAHDADRLGCMINGLRIEDSRHPVPDANGLAAWIERVTGRITYLTEQLATSETDLLAGEVLLRSDQPWRHGEARYYYEVVLTIPGTLTLTRYRYCAGEAERVEIPCNLTLEVFERLVDDLVATMRGPAA